MKMRHETEKKRGAPVPIWVEVGQEESGNPNGQVRRVMKSLQRANLVSGHVTSTHTASGYDVITHLWKITKLGQEVADIGPEAYLRTIRCKRRLCGA